MRHHRLTAPGSPEAEEAGFGVGEDFNYPATTGERPQKTWAEKQIGAYIADLMEIAPHDASVFSDLMPVRSKHFSLSCTLNSPQGSSSEPARCAQVSCPDE